jgi:hypothetical protein
MAANVLGRAYIEVHADTKAFAKELLRETQAIATLAERESGNAGERIGKGLSDGIQRETRRAAPKIAGTLYRSIGRDLFKVGRGGRLISQLAPALAVEAAEVGVKIGGSFAKNFAVGAADGFQAVLKTLGGLVTSIGSSVGNVGSSGPFAAILGVLILTGIPALIGAVIALASAFSGLLNIVFLIPGALSALLASIIPLVVAFQGFGEAIGALASGDVKKINEALKGLTPSARAVVREMFPLVKVFRDIKKLTQESFFRPLVGVFKQLQPFFSNTIAGGFMLVARSAGEFTRQLLLLANDPVVRMFFAQTFEFAASLFRTLGPPVLALLKSLATMSLATFPTLDKLAKGFGNLLLKFANWVDTSVKNGDFDRFMDKMLLAFDNLSRLIDSTWNFIKSLIGGPQEQKEAQEFFDQVIALIDDLTAFFKSPDGKVAIQGMIDLAKIFLRWLGETLMIALLIIGALEAMAQALTEVLRLLGLAADEQRRLVPISSNQLRINAGAESMGAAPGHADGGDFSRQHLAWISEGNKREIILPMTDPKRAMEIASSSGLTSMLNQDMSVNVYIGDEQIAARVERVANASIRQFGRSYKFGPRFVGIGG